MGNGLKRPANRGRFRRPRPTLLCTSNCHPRACAGRGAWLGLPAKPTIDGPFVGPSVSKPQAKVTQGAWSPFLARCPPPRCPHLPAVPPPRLQPLRALHLAISAHETPRLGQQLHSRAMAQAKIVCPGDRIAPQVRCTPPRTPAVPGPGGWPDADGSRPPAAGRRGGWARDVCAQGMDLRVHHGHAARAASRRGRRPAEASRGSAEQHPTPGRAQAGRQGHRQGGLPAAARAVRCSGAWSPSGRRPCCAAPWSSAGPRTLR